MDRLIVVSCDCHADPATPADFGPYVAAEHQGAFGDWLQQMELVAAARENMKMEELFSEDHVQRRSDTSGYEGTAEELEEHRARLASGLSRTSDPGVRLKELEADGVVAEVIFPNGMPFMIGDQRPSGELAAAGTRAYNGWLAELCRAHPGRTIGVAQLAPVADVAATVDQLHEAADSGLRGVTCPTPAAGMPPLIDPVYEPIWEAAEQRGLPLHAHIGWGGLAVDDLPFTSIMSAAGRGVVMAEMRWLSRRCLWLLTYAGVFERHPDLKLVFVEQQADWVPNQLALLDENYDDYQRGHVLRAELPHRPSDYWRRQCFVGASSIARAEVEMRAAIGVETMLFGTDYPHFEATWPNTTLWLKRAFAGVPEAEVRLVLGDNAIRCYGLDRAQLQAAADRVGPLVSDVTGGEDDLDEATARWLDERGLARPAICM